MYPFFAFGDILTYTKHFSREFIVKKFTPHRKSRRRSGIEHPHPPPLRPACFRITSAYKQVRKQLRTYHSKKKTNKKKQANQKILKLFCVFNIVTIQIYSQQVQSNFKSFIKSLPKKIIQNLRERMLSRNKCIS